MTIGVEYIIGLIDRFSPVAEKVAKAAKDADRALNKLGSEAGAVDGKIAKSAEAMSKLAVANEKAGRAVSDFTRLNSRAAQDRARATELEIASLNRVEKLQTQMLERQTARQQLVASGQLKEGRGGREGAGVGIMGGLFAASMLHTDTLAKNLNYDEQRRMLRGVLMQNDPATMKMLEGSAADISKGGVFSQTDVMAAFRDLAMKGVLAKDMPLMTKKVVDIATGAGEDLEKTLKTHLDITRQFNLGLDKLPHISDTLATAQMKSGASLQDSQYYFQHAGTPAALAGVSFEDSTVMEELLALKGLKGTFAGTGVKMMLAHLQTWSKKQTGIYGKLGISKDDVIDQKTGNLKSVEETLAKIRDATTPEKLLGTGMTRGGVLSDLFGSRAAVAAGAIMTSLDKWDEMRAGLEHAGGNAEKMGQQGLIGLSAASKQLEASWNSLDIAIGKSGFNDSVETIMRKAAGFTDWLMGSTTHGSRGMGTTSSYANSGMLQALGFAALAIDGLSKAAMPLMAFSMLGGGAALGGLFRGAAWLTGLSQLKSLGPALAMFGAGSVSGILRFASGIGGLIARSAGLAGLATNLGLVAGAARLLMGMTGIGLGLMIGYEVVKNWDAIAAALTRAAAAMKELAKGNAEPIKKLGTDLGKQIGIDTPKDPRFKAQPHGRLGPGFKGFGAGPGLSAADVMPPVRADVSVTTIIDPIRLIVPPTIRLEGTLTGANGISAQVSGSIPLSATAPRGTTSSTAPSNPQVAR